MLRQARCGDVRKGTHGVDLGTLYPSVVGMRRWVPVWDAGHMRYVFRPPADVASGLLSLPWGLPLEEWKD
ncbi:MAG TPA: hypothetical protein VN786_00910, partial [Acidimicrobiales bacterium]|nr:hypothetical protein [Acidimicrobiales bacterium]